MVPKGNAAVEFCAMATVLTQENTIIRGAGKIRLVRISVRTQATPPICLNMLPDTNPPTTPPRLYRINMAVSMLPLLVMETNPRRAETRSPKVAKAR